MKITLKSLFLLLSALMAVSVSYSCRKSSDAEPTAEAPAEITPLTVIGRIGGADTKVTYTVGDTKISQTWAVDDTIIGISSADSTYTYVVSKVNSDGTASFTFVKGGGDSRYGTATVNPSVGTKMYMIYAPGYAAKDFSSDSLSINISTQDTTTVSSDSASGLHVPAIMTADSTVTGDNKLELTFTNKLELLMITNPTFSGCASGTSISSFTVSGDGILPTKATFRKSGFAVDNTSGGTVTKNCSLTTTSTGTTTGTVLIALMPASTQNLIIKSSNSYADTIPSHTPTASSLLKLSSAKFAPLSSVLLPGEFSVSATKTVKFTNGNLYWDGSAFHIEENQTDHPTSWDDSHVGHFYWTSLTDYQSGNASYMPYALSYSHLSESLTDKFWCGEDNQLIVDGHSGLYALTGGDSGEWYYLIDERTNASNLCKYPVTVTNGGTSYTNCLIIAPDDFAGTLQDSYTLDEVNASGLVCLPAAGLRDENNLVYAQQGYYWSSSPNVDFEVYACSAHDLLFLEDFYNSTHASYCYYGCSIRLVK